MKPEAALARAEQVVREGSDLTVLLGAEADGESLMQRLTLKKQVAQEFRKIARDAVPDKDDEELTIRRYEAGYKPDAHELTYLRVKDEPEIQVTLESLFQVDEAELFSEEQRVIESLRFYAIVIGSGSQQAGFFRAYGPRREVTRSGRFAIMLRKGTYNRLRRNVFTFDDSIDCFVAGGCMFITSAAPG